MISNWVLEHSLVTFLSWWSSHFFIIIRCQEIHSLHHAWTAVCLHWQLVMKDVWTLWSLKLGVISECMVNLLRLMIYIEAWYLLLIIELLNFLLHIRLLVAFGSRILKTTISRRSGINLLVRAVQELRVKSFLEAACILFVAAHRLHLIKRARFVGGIWILNGIISIFCVYDTSFHVYRHFIMHWRTIVHENFIVKVVYLWLWRLWGVSLLLLFGRRRDINIHLDVCVDKIWILQIELWHHAILSCLPCSLFMQACSFGDSMMVWMVRQLIVS
jgi:hypothetical protein